MVVVSSSPRPWIDVFTLPEKFKMAVTESDLDPKVRRTNKQRKICLLLYSGTHIHINPEKQEKNIKNTSPHVSCRLPNSSNTGAKKMQSFMNKNTSPPPPPSIMDSFFDFE